MKEYKVIEAHSPKEAETMMNALAKEGWRVVSTEMWQYWTTRFVVTLEREIEQDYYK